MKINILGINYEVKFGNKNNYPVLYNCDGYTDASCKTIIIDDMKDVEHEIDVKKNIKEYQNCVIRHEVLHAFLHESGLANNSIPVESWALNEEMIDWFAIQFPKIAEAYKKLGIDSIG